jgi:hypothetical protein
MENKKMKLPEIQEIKLQFTLFFFSFFSRVKEICKSKESIKFTFFL